MMSTLADCRKPAHRDRDRLMAREPSLQSLECAGGFYVVRVIVQRRIVIGWPHRTDRARRIESDRYAPPRGAAAFPYRFDRVPRFLGPHEYRAISHVRQDLIGFSRHIRRSENRKRSPVGLVPRLVEVQDLGDDLVFQVEMRS